MLVSSTSPELRADPASSPSPLEVEARGDALAPPPKDPLSAGSVVRADRLASPGLRAGDVLRSEPGVAVSDTGGYGALSTASIRGATAAQTPVYLAGVRLNDDVGGWADLSLVPLWMLHRVEIYRSNAPLEGDQLGIGGAIFFEPKRPKAAEGSVGEMVGSYGARAIWANAGAGNDRISGMVGVRLEEATNDYAYVNDGGTAFNKTNTRTSTLTNADAHTMDVWGIGAAKLGAGGARLDLIVNEVERRQGLPRALFPTEEARASVSRQLVALRASLPCGKLGTRDCELSATTSLLLSRTSYDDPLREVDLETTHLSLVGTRVEEALLAHVPVLDRLSFTPSVRVAMEGLALSPDGAAQLHAERANGRVALGVNAEPYDLLKLVATGAIECDGTVVRGNSPWALPSDSGAVTTTLRPCAQAEPSARLGLQLGNHNIALVANGGRYGRIPTLAELYGLSGAVRGNAELTPEHGLTGDVGLRASSPSSWPSPEAAIDVFAFTRYATDLIAYERTSVGFVQPFNVGAGRFFGGEVAATLRPVRILRLDVALTLLDARDISAMRVTVNDLLPYQARLILTPRAEVKLPVATRELRSVRFAASYFYEGARYADPAGLIVIPAQGQLDVEGELALLDDHLSVRGRIANLLDQPRVDFIGYPLPGRAGYVNMEARW